MSDTQMKMFSDKYKEAKDVITNPLKVKVGEYEGDNWLIAFGYDSKLGEQIYITTDEVGASRLDDLTAKDYADIFVKTPQMQKLLYEVLAKVKPKLVFGEDNEILELLDRIKELIDSE